MTIEEANKLKRGTAVSCNGNNQGRFVCHCGVNMYEVNLFDGYIYVGCVCVNADAIEVIKDKDKV